MFQPDRSQVLLTHSSVFLLRQLWHAASGCTVCCSLCMQPVLQPVLQHLLQPVYAACVLHQHGTSGTLSATQALSFSGLAVIMA